MTKWEVHGTKERGFSVLEMRPGQNPSFSMIAAILADSPTVSPEDQEKHAHLIAAAPEMRDALAFAHRVLQDNGIRCMVGDVDVVAAALAKGTV